MDIRTNFRRYEIKYLLSPEAYLDVARRMAPFIRPDEYGKSTVANIYFDTPDYRLIRRSLEKPAYKEKLRLRTYEVPTADSTAFLELKKKYGGVVYKRREKMTYREALTFLSAPTEDTQIKRELAYAARMYEPLRPAAVIAYDREAFYDRFDPEVRVTFDRNIRARNTDVDLTHGTHGTDILPGAVLMEVKVSPVVPLWLSRILTATRTYPTSFSKYGTAYIEYFLPDRQSGNASVPDKKNKPEGATVYA